MTGCDKLQETVANISQSPIYGCIRQGLRSLRVGSEERTWCALQVSKHLRSVVQDMVAEIQATGSKAKQAKLKRKLHSIVGDKAFADALGDDELAVLLASSKGNAMASADADAPAADHQAAASAAPQSSKHARKAAQRDATQQHATAAAAVPAAKPGRLHTTVPDVAAAMLGPQAAASDSDSSGGGDAVASDSDEGSSDAAAMPERMHAALQVCSAQNVGAYCRALDVQFRYPRVAHSPASVSCCLGEPVLALCGLITSCRHVCRQDAKRFLGRESRSQLSRLAWHCRSAMTLSANALGDLRMQAWTGQYCSTQATSLHDRCPLHGMIFCKVPRTLQKAHWRKHMLLVFASLPLVLFNHSGDSLETHCHCSLSGFV